MKRYVFFILVGILTGCAAREQKSEAPVRERYEEYVARLHAVPEFTQAAEMREAGHQHARNASRLLQLDDIIYHWDKAIECFERAADLYHEGRVKYPEFSEYAGEELHLTYMFIHECVKERPFFISPIRTELYRQDELTEEQREKIKALLEKLSQYEVIRIR